MARGALRKLLSLFKKPVDARTYWDARYAGGGTSGAGSHGDLAHFKADVISEALRKHDCASVIEFGCGDGENLGLYETKQYTGLDVSRVAVEQCRAIYEGDATRRFSHYEPGAPSPGESRRADAVLSLDVLYHVIDDSIYRASLADIFDAATKLVILYTSLDAWKSEPYAKGSHVRHRDTLSDLGNYPWQVAKVIPNRYPEQSSASFVLLTPN